MMRKLSQNEQGYSVLEVGLLIVIVVVIGFVGWYVRHSSDKAYNTYNDATSQSSDVAPSVTKKATTKTSSTTSSTSTSSSTAQ